MNDDQGERLLTSLIEAAWTVPNGYLFIVESDTHWLEDHLTMVIYDLNDREGRVVGFIHRDAIEGLSEVVDHSTLCDQVHPDVAFAVMEADGAARRRSADEA